MIKSITILLLCTLGLATYQLPILWTAYQTVNADFARTHCVNKGTSCNGSCSMKRAYVRSDRQRGRSLPTAVVTELKDLSPFLVQKHELAIADAPSFASRPVVAAAHPISRHTPPPYTPPKS